MAKRVEPGTKLPWAVWEGHTSIHAGVTQNDRYGVKSDGEVCECPPDDWGTDEEEGIEIAEANARYIVVSANAFPSLVAACEEAEVFVSGDDTTMGKRVLRILRAALAAAGE
jgi:hypothetical protein